MELKEIKTTVTEQTYNALYKIANKENKHIRTVIEEIIVKETKTPTTEQIRKICNSNNKTH